MLILHLRFNKIGHFLVYRAVFSKEHYITESLKVLECELSAVYVSLECFISIPCHLSCLLQVPLHQTDFDPMKVPKSKLVSTKGKLYNTHVVKDSVLAWMHCVLCSIGKQQKPCYHVNQNNDRHAKGIMVYTGSFSKKGKSTSTVSKTDLENREPRKLSFDIFPFN